MSAGKRPPLVIDGVEIDQDWLDEQVSHYVPGCADEAIRLLRAFDRADRKRAQQQQGTAA